MRIWKVYANNISSHPQEVWLCTKSGTKISKSRLVGQNTSLLRLISISRWPKSRCKIMRFLLFIWLVRSQKLWLLLTVHYGWSFCVSPPALQWKLVNTLLTRMNYCNSFYCKFLTVNQKHELQVMQNASLRFY